MTPRISTILAALSLLATGCSVAPPVSNYRPAKVDTAYPPIGKETVAKVGDDIVRQGFYTNTKGIVIAKGHTIRNFTLNPGFYPQIGEDEAYTYHTYRTQRSRSGVGYIPPARDILGEWLPAPDAVRAAKEQGELCIIFSREGNMPCNRQASYEQIVKKGLRQGDLQQKLIYAGRNGNKIRIKYWENSGHNARPEYEKLIEFRLHPPQEITHLGARIRVLSADETTLRYSVIQNFPTYWSQPQISPDL